MPIIILNVQGSDTTGDATSNKAGYKKSKEYLIKQSITSLKCNTNSVSCKKRIAIFYNCKCFVCQVCGGVSKNAIGQVCFGIEAMCCIQRHYMHLV